MPQTKLIDGVVDMLAFARRERSVAGVYLLRLNTLLTLAREAVVIYLIVSLFTPEKQGVWYTFSSLGMLAVLVELGFTDMIAQRVSALCARVEIVDGMVRGPTADVERLLGLIKNALRFYMFVTAMVAFVLAGAGMYVFAGEPRYVLLAFLLFSLVKAASLFATLVQAAYQGFDKVTEAQEVVLKSGVWLAVTTIASLLAGLHIWAIVIGNCVGVVAMLYSLYRRAPRLWMQVLVFRLRPAARWPGDILVVQARYGLNAIASYLAFNLFVPAVYRLEGAALAGKLGLSLSIISAASSLSTAFARAKAPSFSILAARGRRRELERLTSEARVRICTAYLVVGGAILGGVALLNALDLYGDRLLDLGHIALMLSSYLVIMIVTPWTYYLRAHGDEPWYVVSSVYALLISAAIAVILPRYGLTGLLVAVAVINWCAVLPLGTAVFKYCKAKYDAGLSVSAIRS